MRSAIRAPATNRLLAALPDKTSAQMLANCESVDLVFADVVCLPGDRIQHVYFPTDSFISLVAPVDGYADPHLRPHPGLGLPLGLRQLAMWRS